MAKMSQQCIERVGVVTGTNLTPAKIKAIEERLSATMRQLAREQRGTWASKSHEQRVREAGEVAARELQAEAQRKVDNAARQLDALVRTDDRISDLQAALGRGRAAAVAADMQNTNDLVSSVARGHLSRLMDTIEAATSTAGASVGRRVAMALFDVQNPAMTRDLVREMYAKASGISGNAMATQGARALLDVMEQMRLRFNAAGGNVGALEYGYIPQPHSQSRVINARVDDWVRTTLPLVDRSRYMAEDGRVLNDAEVSDILRRIYTTIASDGTAGSVPGQYRGTGSRANAGSQHRELHFRDGDAYIAYMDRFGAASFYDAVVGHVHQMARNIVLVERYGPNPEQTMRVEIDKARGPDGSVDRVFGVRLQSMWATLSGKAGALQGRAAEKIAAVGEFVRAANVASKLGGAVISSVTDIGTLAVTAQFNRLPWLDVVSSIKSRALSAQAREDLVTHGLIADTMLQGLNRWTGEHMAAGWMNRVAGSVMKLSLMNAWTDTLRQSFAIAMMRGVERLRATAWDDLSDFDARRLTEAGITRDDWIIVQASTPGTIDGHAVIDIDAISRVNGGLAERLRAWVIRESETAVLNPDLISQTITTGGGMQRGTVSGELARAVMQFKSFPIAMLSRHWRRGLDGGLDEAGAPVSRLAYGSALMVSLIMLGAIALQAKQILSGKDPRDMNEPRFWTSALAQGGGMGILGDLLVLDEPQGNQSMATQAMGALLGPSVSTVFELGYDLIRQNISEAAEGKDTKAAAEAIRFARQNLPFGNLWYTKAIVDQAVFNQAMESVSPGYLARVKQRVRKAYDQEFWFDPALGYQRPPDLGAAFGD